MSTKELKSREVSEDGVLQRERFQWRVWHAVSQMVYSWFRNHWEPLTVLILFYCSYYICSLQKIWKIESQLTLLCCFLCTPHIVRAFNIIHHLIMERAPSSSCYYPILKMGKLRYGEVTKVGQGEKLWFEGSLFQVEFTLLCCPSVEKTSNNLPPGVSQKGMNSRII